MGDFGIGLVGAGGMGKSLILQANQIEGVEVVFISDLDEIPNLEMVDLILAFREICMMTKQSEIVFLTTQKMVWPCLYTALTTICAFTSLVFSGIKPVIDFGWMMTIGLSVTFLTSFILFPSILLLLEKKEGSFNDEGQSRFTGALAYLAKNLSLIHI